MSFRISAARLGHVMMTVGLIAADLLIICFAIVGGFGWLYLAPALLGLLFSFGAASQRIDVEADKQIFAVIGAALCAVPIMAAIVQLSLPLFRQSLWDWGTYVPVLCLSPVLAYIGVLVACRIRHRTRFAER
ncbi:MAG: hypothetical protein ACRYGF_14940 [Janthinobacterium lividum]